MTAKGLVVRRSPELDEIAQLPRKARAEQRPFGGRVAPVVRQPRHPVGSPNLRRPRPLPRGAGSHQRAAARAQHGELAADTLVAVLRGFISHRRRRQPTRRHGRLNIVPGVSLQLPQAAASAARPRFDFGPFPFRVRSRRCELLLLPPATKNIRKPPAVLAGATAAKKGGQNEGI